MIKKIKRRFIKYNMLVISSVILIISVSIMFGTQSEISLHRWTITGTLAILIVYLSSLLISTIAIAPIKEAWQRQLNFTADASHELRTPLSVIRTNLELVIDNPNETVLEQIQWLENSLAETIRMADIVNNLLILSRADFEKNITTKEYFNYSESVKYVINSFLAIATKHNIDICSEIQDNIYIFGNNEYLVQLVLIIIDNSIKYMSSPGKIDVNLISSTKKIILKISDNGIGITSEDLSHIFDRFYRVDKARSHNSSGTGLGLSIAKWIVDSHSGHIEVNSAVGTGTEFTISFPFQ